MEVEAICIYTQKYKFSSKFDYIDMRNLPRAGKPIQSPAA
jgi:hypothetical protein